MKLNIHPKPACGIFILLYEGIGLLIFKMLKVDIINSPPLLIVFIIIGLFLCHFVDKFFTARYQDPRDESIYYDDTFQDDPFEEKEIDKRRE